MEVHDAMVRKCKNVSILIDKKLRERRIEYDKYIIMLDDNAPFSKDDQVKIMRKSDFEKLGEMLKSLKIERDSLKDHNMELRTTLDVQKKLIDKLEPKKEERSFRELIGL